VNGDTTPAADDAPATGPKTRPLLEWTGWIGMALLLGAYAARSFDWLDPHSFEYVGINVVGALMVAVICAAKRAWPAFALEIAWVVLSVPALWGGAA
jgi:hypothetical protein